MVEDYTGELDGSPVGIRQIQEAFQSKSALVRRREWACPCVSVDWGLLVPGIKRIAQGISQQIGPQHQ